HWCTTVTGSFTVTEVKFDFTGTDLLAFAATFEQHCDGAGAALIGEIRYNASASLPALLPPGSPPIADAGSSQTTAEGSAVRLDASASRGAYPLTYAWTQLTGPETVHLSAATSIRPAFFAPVTGTYGFRVTVDDGHGGTASATTTVTAGPDAATTTFV